MKIILKKPISSYLAIVTARKPCYYNINVFMFAKQHTVYASFLIHASFSRDSMLLVAPLACLIACSRCNAIS